MSYISLTEVLEEKKESKKPIRHGTSAHRDIGYLVVPGTGMYDRNKWLMILNEIGHIAIAKI